MRAVVRAWKCGNARLKAHIPLSLAISARCRLEQSNENKTRSGSDSDDSFSFRSRALSWEFSGCLFSSRWVTRTRGFQLRYRFTNHRARALALWATTRSVRISSGENPVSMGLSAPLEFLLGLLHRRAVDLEHRRRPPLSMFCGDGSTTGPSSCAAAAAVLAGVLEELIIAYRFSIAEEWFGSGCDRWLRSVVR